MARRSGWSPAAVAMLLAAAATAPAAGQSPEAAFKGENEAAMDREVTA